MQRTRETTSNMHSFYIKFQWHDKTIFKFENRKDIRKHVSLYKPEKENYYNSL